MSDHWAMPYLNRPWVSGGQGPEAFDCWGLVRYVQREHFGLEVPLIDVNAHDLRACIRTFAGHDERTDWRWVNTPLPGDCVLMSKSRQPTHVGIWIDANGGGVLHAVEGAGVIFSKAQHLKAMAFNVLGYYRHKASAA